jgi:hypothetical protein
MSIYLKECEEERRKREEFEIEERKAFEVLVKETRKSIPPVSEFRKLDYLSKKKSDDHIPNSNQAALLGDITSNQDIIASSNNIPRLLSIALIISAFG